MATEMLFRLDPIDISETFGAARDAKTGAVALHKRIQIMPLGTPVMSDGRKFRVTEQDLATVLSNLSTRKNKIAVLYEHGEGPKGEEAAGWIDSFDADSRGLFGYVVWNADAAAAIKADKWKYLSPGFMGALDDDGFIRPRNLLEASLTNVPAIDGMDPVTASASARAASEALGIHTPGESGSTPSPATDNNAPAEAGKEEHEMRLSTEALALLGLAEGASHEQIEQSIRTKLGALVNPAAPPVVSAPDNCSACGHVQHESAKCGARGCTCEAANSATGGFPAGKAPTSAAGSPSDSQTVSPSAPGSNPADSTPAASGKRTPNTTNKAPGTPGNTDHNNKGGKGMSAENTVTMSDEQKAEIAELVASKMKADVEREVAAKTEADAVAKLLADTEKAGKLSADNREAFTKLASADLAVATKLAASMAVIAPVGRTIATTAPKVEFATESERLTEIAKYSARHGVTFAEAKSALAFN